MWLMIDPVVRPADQPSGQETSEDQASAIAIKTLIFPGFQLFLVT